MDALELNEVSEFRKSLRSDSLIIIDNFEELETRFSIHNELSYWLDNFPKIIITSTVHPSELKSLPTFLVSRLLNGLSLPLEHPSLKTRTEIVSLEIKKLGGELTPAAAKWFAEKVGLTIPLIRQKISELRIHLNFKQKIELSAIQKVFRPQTDQSSVDISLIAQSIARNQKVKVSDLKSQSRKRSIVQARGMAIYIAREYFQFKYDEIGRFFGNRDHSTVMHAHRKFANLFESDFELKHAIQEIHETIQHKINQSK